MSAFNTGEQDPWEGFDDQEYIAESIGEIPDNYDDVTSIPERLKVDTTKEPANLSKEENTGNAKDADTQEISVVKEEEEHYIPHAETVYRVLVSHPESLHPQIVCNNGLSFNLSACTPEMIRQAETGAPVGLLDGGSIILNFLGFKKKYSRRTFKLLRVYGCSELIPELDQWAIYDDPGDPFLQEYFGVPSEVVVQLVLDRGGEVD